MMKQRLECYKQIFEGAHKRWRVYYDEELTENITPNTIYFVITGEEISHKEKEINFSICYVVSREKDGLLNFRDEIKEFINDLVDNFETVNFFNVDGYRIKYSIDSERQTLRIATIEVTYNNTKEILDEEKFINILSLEDRYILND